MPSTEQILSALKVGIRNTAVGASVGFAAGGSISYVCNFYIRGDYLFMNEMSNFLKQHGIQPAYGMDSSGKYVSYCPTNNSHLQQQVNDYANATGHKIEDNMWSSTYYATLITTAVGAGLGFFRGIQDATAILTSPSNNTSTVAQISAKPHYN